MLNQGNWDGMGHMGNFMGGGFMFWILILIVGFLLVGFFKNNNNYQPKEDNALDVLKKRFANSEISEEEYLSKKQILNQ
ncbi:SHOCT domain-containing protein [Sulfurospirillum sp. 1307]|jgi:putative membrane protein